MYAIQPAYVHNARLVSAVRIGRKIWEICHARSTAFLVCPQQEHDRIDWKANTIDIIEYRYGSDSIAGKWRRLGSGSGRRIPRRDHGGYVRQSPGGVGSDARPMRRVRPRLSRQDFSDRCGSRALAEWHGHE